MWCLQLLPQMLFGIPTQTYTDFKRKTFPVYIENESFYLSEIYILYMKYVLLWKRHRWKSILSTILGYYHNGKSILENVKTVPNLHSNTLQNVFVNSYFRTCFATSPWVRVTVTQMFASQGQSLKFVALRHPRIQCGKQNFLHVSSEHV